MFDFLSDLLSDFPLAVLGGQDLSMALRPWGSVTDRRVTVLSWPRRASDLAAEGQGVGSGLSRASSPGAQCVLELVSSHTSSDPQTPVCGWPDHRGTSSPSGSKVHPVRDKQGGRL